MKIGVIYNDHCHFILNQIFSYISKVDVSIIQQNNIIGNDFNFIFVKEPDITTQVYLQNLYHKDSIVVISDTLESNDFKIYKNNEFIGFLSYLSNLSCLSCIYQNTKIDIYFHKIMYISKNVNKCDVYVKNINRPFYYLGTLNRLNHMLPKHFIQINRSEIVNFFYIKDICGDQIILSNNHILYISRRKLKMVTEICLNMQIHSPL